MYPKLDALNYKYGGDYDALTGLQLVFSDGEASPMLETDTAGDAVWTVDIDDTRIVKKARFCSNNSVAFEGLQLYTAGWYALVDLTWDRQQNCDWTEAQEIPDGRSIIGFSVATATPDGHEYISAVSFILSPPS